FFTYSPMISASLCQATILCHSVRSCHSPPLSLYRSLVARLNLATGTPLGVNLTSGSFPRFPTRITLFTLFAIEKIFLYEMLVNIPAGHDLLKTCQQKKQGAILDQAHACPP